MPIQAKSEDLVPLMQVASRAAAAARNRGDMEEYRRQKDILEALSRLYRGFGTTEDMLELEKLKLQPGDSVRMKPKKSIRRRKGSFLRGPIPANWLSIAGNLPGKTLHVALAIWLAYGVVKESRFRFTPKWYAWFDIGPHTLRKSLHRLREAGLIRLVCRPGCSPIVTILDVPEGSKDE